jgi:hypothetical protein
MIITDAMLPFTSTKNAEIEGFDVKKWGAAGILWHLMVEWCSSFLGLIGGAHKRATRHSSALINGDNFH